MSGKHGRSSSGEPPLTEIVASGGGSVDDEDRQTHIEVCVRIRPLVVGTESSTSFLTQHMTTQQLKTPIRRTGISRPSKLTSPSRIGGLGSSRRVAMTPPSQERKTISTPSPTSNNTTDESQDTCAWMVGSSVDTVVQVTESNMVGRTSSYTLDHVYGPQATTKDLYDQSVKALVQAAMDGYHASVLAYGQTSTGKTHTMTGTTKQPGIIPLSIRECFDYLNRLSAPREYLIRLSYMEVYKEHICDLLVPATQQQVPIRLFESATEGLIIKGLKEEVVTSPDEVLTLLAEGESRRQVGATTMNTHSSRSHVIVRLWIESRALSSDTNGGPPQLPSIKSTSSTTSSLASSSRLGNNVRVSSLSLVDLAGSESVRLTGNNDRRQEGHYINQSLMTLGKVVYALSEMEGGTEGEKSTKTKKHIQRHIPYRDSKLTRILQPSLSGNAQVVLVCCISPLSQHLEESHNTFKFAVRAKKIPQKAAIQEEPSDERSLLQSYRDEIEDLKRQLQEAKQAKQTLSIPCNNDLGTNTALAPNPAADLLRAASFTSGGTTTLTDSLVSEDVVSEDEIQALVNSIQTMEKLILKSKPVSPLNQFLRKSAEEMLEDEDYDDHDEEDLLALASKSSTGSTKQSGTSNSLLTPVREPQSFDVSGSDVVAEENEEEQDADARNLEIELSRIQGLLGSVLKKRKQKSRNGSSNHSISSSSGNHEELQVLRAQLEQHEAASTIRKADSSFLQKQLEEKEDLLMEVSKLLEQMETRQVSLEKDNAQLRRQVLAYQIQYGDMPNGDGGRGGTSMSLLRTSPSK